VIVALIALAPWAVQANDEPRLSWSGYGTLSAFQAQVRGAGVRPDPLNAGVSRDGDWRLDGDSRLAGQARLGLPAGLEAVVQLASSNALDGHYRPRVMWAYLNWAAAPSFNVRVGRQTLPVLRQSETRDVGVAQVAVRPNPAVYALSVGAPIDGANATWERSVGSSNWRLDLGAGTSKATLGRTRIDVRRSLVAALQWQDGPWMLRGAASDFRVDLGDLSLSRAPVLADCLNCADLLASRASGQGVAGQIYSSLLVWDGHPWEVSAEAVWRSSSSSVLVPRAWGAYVQISRRQGDWRWHAAAGRQTFKEPALGLAPRADASPASRTGLAVLDQYLQSPNDLENLQAGVALDITPQMVLKLQHEHWRATRDRSTGRNGLIVLAAPPLAAQASQWNGRARLTTVSVDFVF
jgi:hypothetical protein